MPVAPSPSSSRAQQRAGLGLAGSDGFVGTVGLAVVAVACDRRSTPVAVAGQTPGRPVLATAGILLLLVVAGATAITVGWVLAAPRSARQ